MSFTAPFLGTIRSVLFENSSVEGMMNGFTDNYIKVTMPLDTTLINKIENVELLEWDGSCDAVVSNFICEKV